MSVRLDIALEGVVKDAGVGLLLVAYTTSDVSTTADPCRLLLGLAFRDLDHRIAELIGIDGFIKIESSFSLECTREDSIASSWRSA